MAIISIFIPPLSLVALALTAGVLAGHLLLTATGNGSWVDVAIDVFALFTLGAGRVVGTMAKEARAATLARAADLGAADASRGVTTTRAALRLEYEQAASGFGKFAPKGFRSYLSLKTGFFDTVTEFKAGLAASRARTALLNRPLPKVTNVQALKSLGKDFAQNLADIKALRALYGNDAQFAKLANSWQKDIRLGQAATGAGQFVDLTNHAITKSDIPRVNTVLRGVPPWEHFKEWATQPLTTP